MMNMVKSNASDISDGDWINRLIPKAIKPYFRLARIDRPIGVWLLLLPCWWSIALATPSLPNVWLMTLFAVGAIVMRGAGCTINDIADRKFDAQVARTASRPIPSGAVSVPRAIAFLSLLLLAGLFVLIQFNAFTIVLGIGSLVLVAIYPLMKRITYWPQLVLGLAFNWGALMGWAAVKGSIEAAPIALYAAGVLWTLGYDTIYAHQDKEDDILIGLKSTALKFGDATRPWLYGFYGGSSCLIALAGYLTQLSWPFYAIMLIATGHLAWQTARVDISDPKDCLAKFKSNRYFGWIVLGGIIIGQITR